VAVGLNLLATDVIKHYVGYLRPIFFDLCQPSEDYSECTAAGDNHEVRLSFPSGHASLSMCGLLLFSKLLEQRFGVSSPQRTVYQLDAATGQIWMQQAASLTSSSLSSSLGLYRMVSLLCHLPVALALFIAASRVVDNKHFPADVVGGAVLGGSIATLIHGIWCVFFVLCRASCIV
jgi:membrane-associated phospholipid phosphatase